MVWPRSLGTIRADAPRSALEPLQQLWSHYLVRRIAKAIFTIYFVSTLIFFLVRLLPGSPVEVYINQLVGQYGYSYDVAADQARSLFAGRSRQAARRSVSRLPGRTWPGRSRAIAALPGVPVTDIIFKYLSWTLFSVGVGLLLAFTWASSSAW